MLPFVTNSALGGSVQLAAFVSDRAGHQQHCQQQPSWGSTQRQQCPLPLLSRAAGLRPSAATACGLLVVASACCPPRPRSGRLQVCASRSKTRRRRSGSSSGGDDDGDFSDFGDWSLDSWSSLYGGSGGDNNNNNNNSGGGGGGGWGHSWDSAGGDAFRQAVYHATWVWEVVCAASLLRTLYFLLFTDAVAQELDAVAVGGSRLEHVAMAC